MLRSLLVPAAALSLLTAVRGARAEDAPTFADRPDREVAEEDRTFGVLLNPLAAAIGVYGVETDFVLGRHLAASVEGALYNPSGAPATALGTGLLCYPGAAFYGLVLEPRLVYARPLNASVARWDLKTDVLGFGATAGWQWTWDYGFTLRVGAGGMYFVGGSGPAPHAVALGGPELVLDGAVGWTF
jgi:hypothetical protein